MPRPEPLAVLTSPLVLAAKEVATETHAGQFRWAKPGTEPKPFITHPERVACLLVGLPWAGKVEMAAAWLHDVLEMRPNYLAHELEVRVAEAAARLSADEKTLRSDVYHVIQLVKQLTNPSRLPPMARATDNQKLDADVDHFRSVVDSARKIKLLERYDNLKEAEAAGMLTPEVMRYARESLAWATAAEKVDPVLGDQLKRVSVLAAGLPHCLTQVSALFRCPSCEFEWVLNKVDESQVGWFCPNCGKHSEFVFIRTQDH